LHLEWARYVCAVCTVCICCLLYCVQTELKGVGHTITINYFLVPDVPVLAVRLCRLDAMQSG